MSIFDKIFLKCENPKEDKFEEDYNRTYPKQLNLPIEIPNIPFQDADYSLGNNVVSLKNLSDQYIFIFNSIANGENKLATGMIQIFEKQANIEIQKYKNNGKIAKANELEINLNNLKNLNLEDKNSIITFLSNNIKPFVMKGNVQQAKVLATKINALDDFEKICETKIINYVCSNNIENAKKLFIYLPLKNQADIIDILINNQISQNPQFTLNTSLFKDTQTLSKLLGDDIIGEPQCHRICAFLKNKYRVKIKNIKEKIESISKKITETEKKIFNNTKKRINTRREILNIDKKILNVKKKINNLDKELLPIEKLFSKNIKPIKVKTEKEYDKEIFNFENYKPILNKLKKEDLNQDKENLNSNLEKLPKDSENLKKKLEIQNKDFEKLNQNLKISKKQLENSKKQLENSIMNFEKNLLYIDELPSKALPRIFDFGKK